MVKLLVDAGVDIGHRDRDGNTALSYAVFRRLPGPDPFYALPRSQTIICALLEEGLDPNEVDAAGYSVLHRDVSTRASPAVLLLVRSHSSPSEGCTVHVLPRTRCAM